LRNTNDYGNNIFIDNVQITPVDLVDNDLQLLSVIKPNKIICEGNINPRVSVKNAGSATILGFKLGYRVDNNNLITKDFQGVNLSSGNVLQVELPATEVAIGQHVLTAFVYDLVTANANGDEQLKNDTLLLQFGMSGKIASPITESFESSFFPP